MYNKRHTSFNIFYTREHVPTGQELSFWNKALIYRRSVDGRYMIEYLEPPLGFESKQLGRIYEGHNDSLNFRIQ